MTAQNGRGTFTGKEIILIVLISVVYLSATAGLASKRAPWNDEGWFADPAYTLATQGYMGSPIIHPRGTWLQLELTGIHTHTYWVMPVHLLLQAAWYRVFGFGLLQMRSISILAGLVVMWAWALVVWKIAQNKSAAYLTAAILAIDVTFLYGATDGRMDMTTVAFGSLGLAAFLCLRERHLMLSLLVSNGLIAAGMFSHPNGIIYAVLLVLFVARYDLRALRWRHLFCLAPYVVFAGGWAIYILQRPDYFIAQFRANSKPPIVSRTAGLRHPLDGLVHEVSERYLNHFGGSSIWARLPRQARIIPFLYWGCLAWLLVEGVLKRNRSRVFIGLCTVVTFLLMGVLIGLRASNYLVAIIPLYAAVVALAAWPDPGRRNRTPMVMLAALMVVQGLSLSIMLLLDDYHGGYLPAVQYLKEHASRQTSINGSPGLLFGLPTYQLTADSRLHEPAEYVVVDRWSQFDWGFVYKTYEPWTAADVQGKLESYDPVFNQGGWMILHRRKVE